MDRSSVSHSTVNLPAPGSFSITGATNGGTDVTLDPYLMDGNLVTANWQAASNAVSYDVTIYQNDGTTVQCPTQNVAAPTTVYSFASCTLSYGATYKISVVAISAEGGRTFASNDLFDFYVQHTPTAVTDTYFVQENGSAATLSVLSNDSDNGDGNTLRISSVNVTGTSGTVSSSASTVTYTPSSNFTGVDTLTYTVWDGHNGYATATVTVKVMGNYTWTGSLGNSTWDNSTANAGNWCGTVKADYSGCNGASSAPTTSNTVIFDGTCGGSNCNASIRAAISVGTLQMNSGYTGTLSQITGNTINTNTWNQAAGTFVGSSGGDNISINRSWTLSGGSFTSTSGTLTSEGGGWSTALTVTGTPTFNDNGGTVVLYGYGGPATFNIPSSFQFNNVTLTDKGTGGSVVISGTINVLGNLELNFPNSHCDGLYSAVNGGTVLAHGDIKLTQACISGVHGVVGSMGTTTVKLVGSSDQTITGGSSSTDFPSIPNLVIASTGGTVTLNGTIAIDDSFTYTSGNVVINSPLVVFSITDSASTISAGSLTFNDVMFHGWRYSSTNATISGTLKVAGSFTQNLHGGSPYDKINGGAIQVAGDYTAQSGDGGSTSVIFNGSGVQTLTQTSGVVIPGSIVTVDGGTNTLTLGSAVTLSNGNNQSLTVTSGDADMAGNDLTISANLSLNGNTLTKNGGTLTVSGSTVGTGSLYGGTVN